MRRRSRARVVALQLLFLADQNPKHPRPDAAAFASERIDDEESAAFALALFDGVAGRRGDIDAAIEQSSSNWSLRRMPAVERNVLRLGVYEAAHADPPTPAAVAIDEAVELAKFFGGKQSPAFVNGVLDGVLKKGPPRA